MSKKQTPNRVGATTGLCEGRVLQLNRSHGYGFFAPAGSKRRIYFHFSDKQDRNDILTEGDVISACIERDEQNRLCGKQIRRMRTRL